MNYTEIKNLVWANEEHTAITCEVNFEDFAEEFTPFTAVPENDYPHSHKIFAECVQGLYGEIAEYVPPPPVYPIGQIPVVDVLAE